MNKDWEGLMKLREELLHTFLLLLEMW